MEDPTELIQTLMDNHHISNISNENPKTNKKVPIYKGNEPCWSVVKIEGKGDGVVAKRDIEYGELIAQERPVMKILAHQENEDSLKAMFANLSEQEQLSVTSLCDSRSKDGTKSLLGIKQSNSFAKDAEGQLSVICPKLSKFNHSCLQNVDHVFVEPFQRVYAVRNIQKGEELCTAYVSLFDSHDVRRKKLEERYGFECTCRLCEMNLAERSEIENARIKYKELEREITSTPNPEHILRLMKEKYLLMSSGQIMFPRFIRMHAFDCIQLALAFGNLDEANKYIEKGYQATLIEEGKKGPRSQEYAKCISKKISAQQLVQNILNIV